MQYIKRKSLSNSDTIWSEMYCSAEMLNNSSEIFLSDSTQTPRIQRPNSSEVMIKRPKI